MAILAMSVRGFQPLIRTGITPRFLGLEGQGTHGLEAHGTTVQQVIAEFVA
jgi:hypothetical protein